MQQGCQSLLTVVERSCGPNIFHGVFLHRLLLAALPEDIEQLLITRITIDAVDDQKRKFTFREVFTEPFVFAVQVTLKILIVVTDLKDDAQKIHKAEEIATLVNDPGSSKNM